jgi:hypothetical protein
VSFTGRVERAELLALDVLGRDDGQPVTRAAIEARIAQLAGHSPSCRCGRCWWLAGYRGARVKAYDVWRVLRGWGVAQPPPVVVVATKTVRVTRDRRDPQAGRGGDQSPPARVSAAHTCWWCSGVFTAKRVDARYCSAVCRVAAYRSRR